MWCDHSFSLFWNSRVANSGYRTMKLLVLLLLCTFAGLSSGLGFRDLLVSNRFSVNRSGERWVNWIQNIDFYYDFDWTSLLDWTTWKTAWLQNGSGNNKKWMIMRRSPQNVRNPIFESTQSRSRVRTKSFLTRTTESCLISFCFDYYLKTYSIKNQTDSFFFFILLGETLANNK